MAYSDFTIRKEKDDFKLTLVEGGSFFQPLNLLHLALI
jgi:hypothetical protein